MPIYTFYNELNGMEWDEMITNAEREEFLAKNPQVKQIPGGFATVGDHLMGVGPKQVPRPRHFLIHERPRPCRGTSLLLVNL